MTRFDTDPTQTRSRDDLKDTLHGALFLLLMGVGLYVNMLVRS